MPPDSPCDPAAEQAQSQRGAEEVKDRWPAPVFDDLDGAMMDDWVDEEDLIGRVPTDEEGNAGAASE